MAIKVGGTTVIDDSRALSNIASVDATTVAALGAAGIAGGGGTIDLVAAENFTAGDLAVLDSSTGKAAKPTVTDAVGSDVSSLRLITQQSYDFDMIFDATSGRAIAAANFSNNNAYRAYYITNTSDGSVNFNQGQIIGYNFAVQHTHMAYDPVEGTAVFFYRTNSDKYKTGQMNANGYLDFSEEQSLPFNLGNDPFMASTYDPDTGKIIVIWRDSTDSNKVKYVLGTASGNSVSWGTPGTVSTLLADSNRPDAIAVTYDETANRVLVCFVSASYIRAVAGEVSGDTISWGTLVTDTTYLAFAVALTYVPSAGKNLLVYGSDSVEGTISIVFTLSGSTVSKGAVTTFGNKYAYYNDVVYNPDTTGLLVATSDDNNSGRVIPGEISGTTFSVTNGDWVFESGRSQNNKITYNSSLSKLYVVHTDANDNDYPYIETAGAAASDVANFIGVAAETVSTDATGKFTVLGGLNEEVTGLTTDTRYFASVGGSLTAADTGVSVGRAIAADKILVTGGA